MSPACHPELGWLCPSRSFRRKARIVLVFIAFLMIVGVIFLKPGYHTDNYGAPMLARGDEAQSDAEPDQTVGQTIPSATAKKSRNLRSPRAANEVPAIAALPLGRRVPETSPVAPVGATGAEKIVLLAPDATATTGPPASARRKAQKPPHSRSRGRDLRHDWRSRDRAWSAGARHNYPFGRYERPWGW